ncbi:MAG: tetratricopeptide repeat protein, partial [Planctomycetota bacterium]|nr:tetratricopeptide repeat protein [Planctomycetota bacterium]
FFEAALKRLSPGAFEERREMLAAFSDCLIKLGRHSEARAVLFQELTVCRQLDDALARQDALARMARVNVHLRAYEQARRFFFESLKTARELSSYEGVRENLHELGQLTVREGRLDEALAYFQESLGLLESLGEGSEKPRLFRAMARALLGKGETERALKKAREALALEEQSGSSDHLLESYILLAQIHDKDERPRAVVSNCEKALAQLGDGQCRDAARPLILLGAAREKLGQRTLSTASLTQAALIARRNNDRDDLAWALYHQGSIASKDGALEAALEFFNEATTLWNMLGNQSHYSLGLVALGTVYRRVGRGSRALHCFQKARRLARSHKLFCRDAEASSGEAQILIDRGCYVQARHLLSHAMENCVDKVSSSPQAAELRALFVFLLAKLGQKDSSHSVASLIQGRRCADFANWKRIERLLCRAAIERCDGAEIFQMRPMTRVEKAHPNVLGALRDQILEAQLALFLGQESNAIDLARCALEQSQKLNLPLDEVDALVIMVESVLRALQIPGDLSENDRLETTKKLDLYLETALRKASQIGLHGATRRLQFFAHQFKLLSGDVQEAFVGFRSVLSECQEDAHLAYDIALEVRYARSLLQMETVFQIDFVTDSQETAFQFIRRQMIEARVYIGSGLIEAADRAKAKANDSFQTLSESLPPLQKKAILGGSRLRALKSLKSPQEGSVQVSSTENQNLMLGWLTAYRHFHDAKTPDALIERLLTESLRLFAARRAAFYRCVDVRGERRPSIQLMVALNGAGQAVTKKSEMPDSAKAQLISERARFLWESEPPLLDLPIRQKGDIRFRLCLELTPENLAPSSSLNAQILSLSDIASSLFQHFAKDPSQSFASLDPNVRSEEKSGKGKKASERLPPQRVDFNLDRPLKACLEDVERQILTRALERYNNNKTHAAKALGLSRFGFLKKLDKHGLRD